MGKTVAMQDYIEPNVKIKRKKEKISSILLFTLLFLRC